MSTHVLCMKSISVQFIVAVAVISTSQNNNCKRGLNCFVLK